MEFNESLNNAGVNMPARHYSFINAILILAITTLLLLPFLSILSLANVTMIYLLSVLIIAIQLGTLPAMLASFICVFCINYFFMEPFFALRVSTLQELVDICVFFIVSILSGQLGARGRQIAEEAQQRAREQEILYHLAQAFNQSTTPDDIYLVLTHAMQTDLGAQQARILPPGSPKSYQPGQHSLLLAAGEQMYGLLQVVFATFLAPQQLNLLNTCALQAAMALQRIELTERANKSLQFEEADKLKTAILHAVSHDLRTPITIIKSAASNLGHFHQQLSLQAFTETADTIEKEADQLDKLVSNLLDMSRLNAGLLALNRHQNSLEEIAGDVAARVWQLTKQERIRIIFPEDMPLIPFDYGLILQAVTNLVENALRYEPVHEQIVIQGEVQGESALIKVVNHGETISEEVKERMMEPFYRGKEGRTGLGLPIANGIIEAHQGRLWVENTPESGTTFVIALPIASDQPAITGDFS
jgi:two-component system, OmpR family, sensor histidine kinase KdpD